MSSITISSFFSNHVQGDKRALLEDISREKEVQMSALKKGLKVSSTGANAGSFRIRKNKSSPCGPYFPGTLHSMDAVRKHTLSIGST